MQTGLIVVELSTLQAEQFVSFQKHYIPIVELIREGIFDIRGGRGIIDFNDGGGIDRVIKILYSKNKKLSTVSFDNLPLDN